MFGWWRRWKENKALLRKEVDLEGQRYETRSYEELRALADTGITERVVEGHELAFHADVHDIGKNGDLSVCVEVWGLPTPFGITPCYHFHKRPDGSVYY